MTTIIRGDTSGSVYLVLVAGIILWITRFGVAADGVCGRPGHAKSTVHEPVGDSFREGDRIRYRCTEPGYVLLGESERMCLEKGSWSGDMPVCSKPALIEEASLDNEDPKAETTFSIDGDISTCTSHSMYNKTTWEGSISPSENISAVRIVLEGRRGLAIDVEIKDDRSPGTKCINGGESTGTGSSEKTKTITYFCPAGTVGKQARISISHVLRICEVYVFYSQVQQCVTPDIPGNGYGKRSVSFREMSYRFYCYTGYDLFGSVSTSCQPNGIWHPKSPTCKKVYCEIPNKPNNGRVEYQVISGQVPYNGSAKYSCNDGFYLEGSSTRTCIRWRTWDIVSEPKCKAAFREMSVASTAGCDPLPFVANGYLVLNATSSGAVLKCIDGFKPLATDSIVCLETGEWSSYSLKCQIIQCEANPVIPHGAAILLENSTYYGAHLKIECNQGYTSDDAMIRRCEESGTWGDLNVCVEITCGRIFSNDTNGGKWISLNDSHSMRILSCPEGFHIEGSPPVTQCLTNGTWSYTSAKCRNSFEDDQWRSSLSPSLMLIAAVAVGALTAVCILCLAVGLWVIKKRRQSRTNTTVFHLGDTIQTDTTNVPNFLQMKHHSTTGCYDETIELRTKTVCRNPRKPRSALPNLPLDADPVYAQPFETATATKKTSVTAITKKDDLYNAHIYAEPVDSRISLSDPNKVPISISMCRTGVNPGLSTIKPGLRNESLISVTNDLNCDKKCAIYDTSDNTPSFSSGKLPLAVDEKHQNNNARVAVETFIDNSQYLEFV